MKTILAMVIAVNLCFYGEAQGNLQFNRVVFIESDTTLACNSPTFCYLDTILLREIFVQPNKVLKIESINSTLGVYSGGLFGLYLDKLRLTNPAENNGQYFVNFPIWLSAGNHKIYFYGDHSGGFYSTTRYTYQISALEFNITQ